MNKNLAYATLSLIVLTSCNGGQISAVKSSEPVIVTQDVAVTTSQKSNIIVNTKGNQDQYNKIQVEPLHNKSNTVTKKEENDKNKIKFYNIKLSKANQKLVWEYCKKYGVDYEFALAVIYHESGFETNKVYTTKWEHSIGLFQINSKTTLKPIEQKLGKNINLKNAEDNIQAGVYWLKYNMDYYKKQGFSDKYKLQGTYVIYNMGIGAGAKYIRNNGVSHKNSNHVMEVMKQLKTIGGIK